VALLPLPSSPRHVTSGARSCKEGRKKKFQGREKQNGVKHTDSGLPKTQPGISKPILPSLRASILLLPQRGKRKKVRLEKKKKQEKPRITSQICGMPCSSFRVRLVYNILTSSTCLVHVHLETEKKGKREKKELGKERKKEGIKGREGERATACRRRRHLLLRLLLPLPFDSARSSPLAVSGWPSEGRGGERKLQFKKKKEKGGECRETFAAGSLAGTEANRKRKGEAAGLQAGACSSSTDYLLFLSSTAPYCGTEQKCKREERKKGKGEGEGGRGEKEGAALAALLDLSPIILLCFRERTGGKKNLLKKKKKERRTDVRHLLLSSFLHSMLTGEKGKARKKKGLSAKTKKKKERPYCLLFTHSQSFQFSGPAALGPRLGSGFTRVLRKKR